MMILSNHDFSVLRLFVFSTMSLSALDVANATGICIQEVGTIIENLNQVNFLRFAAEVNGTLFFSITSLGRKTHNRQIRRYAREYYNSVDLEITR